MLLRVLRAMVYSRGRHWYWMITYWGDDENEVMRFAESPFATREEAQRAMREEIARITRI